jgi:hypothetical protein
MFPQRSRYTAKVHTACGLCVHGRGACYFSWSTPSHTTIGFNKVEAESDVLEVIQMCAGDERIWNDATTIYAEIMTTAGNIGEVEFLHCNRELNNVAHLIARESVRSRTSCIWVDERPSFILQHLLDDVTIM